MKKLSLETRLSFPFSRFVLLKALECKAWELGSMMPGSHSENDLAILRDRLSVFSLTLSYRLELLDFLSFCDFALFVSL